MPSSVQSGQHGADSKKKKGNKPPANYSRVILLSYITITTHRVGRKVAHSSEVHFLALTDIYFKSH